LAGTAQRVLEEVIADAQDTPSRCLRTVGACPFLGRLSVTKAETADDLVKALDRYAERLWRAKLAIAASFATTTLRLVWLTAGFSVSANRVCAGDYVCALDPRDVARRAHLRLSETGDAVAHSSMPAIWSRRPAIRALVTAFAPERWLLFTNGR